MGNHESKGKKEKKSGGGTTIVDVKMKNDFFAFRDKYQSLEVHSYSFHNFHKLRKCKKH
jgi:hypothetical protein